MLRQGLSGIKMSGTGMLLKMRFFADVMAKANGLRHKEGHTVLQS
tara:strand:+ start:203 stop:337 length:135 start_codon:yes stop_codon:yes gene_type:complete